MEPSDRANNTCGDRPVSRLSADDNTPLFTSRHQEGNVAAALERWVGQRDACLGFCANDSDYPASPLLQCWLTGKQ